MDSSTRAGQLSVKRREKAKVHNALAVRALCGIGGVYNLLGSYKDGLHAYARAEMLASDQCSIIKVLIGQVQIRENLSEYDSMLRLLNRLAKLSRGTSEEVYVLSRYCWVYRLQGKMEASHSAADRGMKLLERLKKRGLTHMELYHVEGAIVNALGNLHWNQGAFDKAIELHQRFLEVSEESENLYGIGMALNNMGSVYVHKGEYDKAIPLFKRKLAISEQLGNKIGMAMAANNLGVIYNHNKSFDRAIELYEQALLIADELNDLLGVVHVSINLGSIHKDRADYNQAFTFFRRGMKIAEKIKDTEAIGAIYLEFGDMYKELNELHKSTEYLKKARMIFEKSENKVYLSAAIQVTAEVEIQEFEEERIDNTRERLQRTYRHIDEKLKLAEEMNSAMDRGIGLLLQARIASLDVKYDKNTVKGKFIKSIKLFEEHKIPDELGRAYYYYAIYLDKINESKTARICLAKAKRIFKSIGNVIYLNKIDIKKRDIQ
jgi:tetratricopeptide (TPR) repeat protein